MIGGSWIVKHAELQRQQVLQEMDMKVLREGRITSINYTDDYSPQKCVTMKRFGLITGGRCRVNR